VGRAGDSLLLRWEALGTSRDVVAGDLDVLRGTHGGYGAALESCPVNDAVTTAEVVADPAPGRNLFFLVRSACIGGATYDSGGPGQAPRRVTARSRPLRRRVSGLTARDARHAESVRERSRSLVQCGRDSSTSVSASLAQEISHAPGARPRPLHCRRSAHRRRRREEGDHPTRGSVSQRPRQYSDLRPLR
jgi:hypothetical protein